MNGAEYYAEKLAEGQEFQDYVAAQLYHEGIVLVNFQSRAQQLAMGENLLGLEIKFDQKFAVTNHLWIEVQERRDPTGLWVAAGIDRDDNGWLYGIGNRCEFFIFSKKYLQDLVRRNSYVIEMNHRATSRGFRLPRKDAARYADKCCVWRIPG